MEQYGRFERGYSTAIRTQPRAGSSALICCTSMAVSTIVVDTLMKQLFTIKKKIMPTMPGSQHVGSAVFSHSV